MSSSESIGAGEPGADAGEAMEGVITVGITIVSCLNPDISIGVIIFVFAIELIERLMSSLHSSKLINIFWFSDIYFNSNWKFCPNTSVPSLNLESLYFLKILSIYCDAICNLTWKYWSSILKVWTLLVDIINK